MMKFTPASNSVLIKVKEQATTTKGGLFIPSTASKHPCSEAEVIKVGPGKILDNGNRIKMTVQAGDIILVHEQSLHEISLDGEKFHLVNEDAVLGVLEK